MRTEIVTEPQRLAAIAGAWDALLSRCRDPQPALSPRWQLAWWEVFGDPDSVGEQLTAVKATGVDGFTINLAVNGHQTDRIGLLGEIANKALG